MTAIAPEPIAAGLFGPFGGCYVAENLMAPLQALQSTYHRMRQDPAFWQQLNTLRRDFTGRPTPLYHAVRTSDRLGGAQILLKREDLNHTGAHKINNCLGQILLAKAMGKTRIIAETGAGQHGVATATVCALMGLECVVFMGVQDMARQRPNVERMQLLGAEVRPVEQGNGTLKDAMNAALRDWVTYVGSTYYLIGTAAGPHPYPTLVRDFQRVIGEETRQQCLDRFNTLPDTLVACVGGGSNAIGLFHPFLDDPVELIGVEAAGHGLSTRAHAASLQGGRPGILHGNHTYLLQDNDGQILDAHSISAGLDYPGIGPEHAFLHEQGRVRYVGATDAEALAAFRQLCREEGIIPALESAHALAEAYRLAPRMRPDQTLVVCLSGRGDKDMNTVTGAGDTE